MKQRRKDFNTGDAGSGFLLTAAFLLGAQVMLALVWIAGMRAFGWPGIEELSESSFAFIILTGIGLQAVLALFYFGYTRLNGINPFAAPRAVNMPARNWALSAAAGVTALFGLMFTSFAFGGLLEALGYNVPEGPAADTAGRAVAAVIAIGILPAVFEELIFRGMILRGLSGLGKWKAVLISAAAFAMIHMSPAQTVHQFLIGVIMGLMAWETGSILAPMLIHFINNTLAVVLDVSGAYALFGGMLIWQIIVIALVTFAATCGIMYLILRWIKKPQNEIGKGAGAGVCAPACVPATPEPVENTPCAHTPAPARQPESRDVHDGGGEQITNYNVQITNTDNSQNPLLGGGALGTLIAGFAITAAMWIAAWVM